MLLIMEYGTIKRVMLDKGKTPLVSPSRIYQNAVTVKIGDAYNCSSVDIHLKWGLRIELVGDTNSAYS